MAKKGCSHMPALAKKRQTYVTYMQDGDDEDDERNIYQCYK